MENIGKLSPDTSTGLLVNQFRFYENSFFKDTQRDSFYFALRNNLSKSFLREHCTLTILSLIAYPSLSAVLYSFNPALSLVFLAFFGFSLYRFFGMIFFYDEYLTAMSKDKNPTMLLSLEKNAFSKEALHFLGKIDKEDALRLFYDYYDKNLSQDWRRDATNKWLNMYYQDFEENKTEGYGDVMFVLSKIFEENVQDYSTVGMLTE